MQGMQQPSTISAPPMAAGQAAAPVDDSQIDPDIVARGTEWTEHKAPDGRSYFYNAKLGESVWEKPQPLKDLESEYLTVVYLGEAGELVQTRFAKLFCA